ncbi:MAG: DUF1501 domain-containing protein [Pseudomonadota bacterium]
MALNRRNFIRGAGAGALAAGAAVGVPTVFTSHAAEVIGYKALVCVFLFGGIDCHDVLIPSDAGSYNSWRAARAPLVAQYGASRDRGSLLPLSRASQPSPTGPQFALPPELAGIRSIYDQGNAAFIANVGPLVGPVTRAGFEAGNTAVPPRLFSHNDQQVVWQAGAPEGAQFGWGGLFADAVVASGANRSLPQFTSIVTDEAGPFSTGRQTSPYRVPIGGSNQITLLNNSPISENQNLVNQVRSQLASRNFAGSHVLKRDIASAFADGIDNNALYQNAFSAGRPVIGNFGNGPLSRQLQGVAETIALRQSFSANRQIFFVSLGGFDTHSAQALNLTRLLTEMNDSISAFHAAMGAAGLSNQVTLFTASDFGRTLVANGDGTDHGWGGHQMVVGGAVSGREIYGSVPPPVTGHNLDAGNGRLIPDVAVEQYAQQLGRWFGLNDAELRASLPNLGRFTAPEWRFI